MKKIAIITGASSGMGKVFAETINTYDTFDEVWVIARRLDRLEELETKQLDFFDHGKRCAEPVATHWGQIATANIVYMTMLW